MAADEFFGAIREVTVMSGNEEVFEKAYEFHYKRFMHENDFVVSLIEHKAVICEFID